ncbi:DUF6264 family protein [Leucobacter sp. HY1910]
MTDGPATPQDSAAPEEPTPPPVSRPKPAYGELAPEGWEWKPEGASDDTNDASATHSGATHPAAAPGGAAQSLPGVPHNLGAGLPKRGAKSASGGRAEGGASAGSGPSGTPAAGPGAQSTGPQGSGAQAPEAQGPSTPGAPYRAPGAGASGVAPQQGSVPGAAAKPSAPKPRIADRVITIGLLVLAAYSTLSIASSMFALESQLRLVGAMIGLEHATLAEWVKPLGTGTGIAVLALFAVTLIYSIQRMRARRLAFWVPLTAGAIAVLIVLIVPTVAMFAGAPEIMQQLDADPNGSLDKMFAYIKDMQM